MLPTTTRKQQYAIAYPFNTDYTFDFKFWDPDQISVILSFSDTSAPQTLTPAVDFSVSAPGDSGTVTKLTDWNHAATRITIVRTITFNQDDDYRNGEATDMDLQVEKDFDMSVARDQELQEQLDRVIKQDITDPATNLVLPSAAARRGLLLGFDSTPEAEPMASPGTGGVATSAFMATVLDDLNGGAALSTLGVSAFAKTMLDDADAAALRATIAAEVVEDYTPVSGYAPAAGDVVALLNSGEITKAVRANKAALASGSAVAAARVAKLDATHAVVVYAVGLQITAVIITVNPADLSISFGTPFNVFLCTTTLAAFDVAPIDGTHVLVATSVTGGAASFTQGTVRVLIADINAGTLSNGNTANTSATSAAMALYPIPGGSNILLCWMSAATTFGGVVISGGTTPVYNTPQTVATGTIGLFAATPLSICVSSAGDGGFAMLEDSGTPFNTKVLGFRINALVLSSLTVVDLLIPGTAGASFYPLVEEGPADAFTIYTAWSNAGANPTCMGFGALRRIASSPPTLSATGPNGASPAKMGIYAISAAGIMRPIDRAAGVFCISIGGLGADGNTWYHTWIFKRKGGGQSLLQDYEFGDEYVYKPGGGGGGIPGMDLLSSGILIVAIATGSASGTGSQVIALRRQNRVFGVATDNAGHVRRTGKFVTTGLAAGADYFSDDSGALTTAPSEVRIGWARSSTELVLDVRPGI